MEEFITILTASGIIATIFIGIVILNWILYLKLTSDVSIIKEKIRMIEKIELENNEIYVAILNEIRRGNDINYRNYRKGIQEQQMDSIEPPKL